MKNKPLAFKFLQILMAIIVLMIVFIIGTQVGIYQTNQQWHKNIDSIMNEGLHE